MKTILLAAILTGLALGQSPPAKPVAAVPVAVTPAPKVKGGRYQIVFGPHARADTFLLDTETGKIWTRTTFTFLEGDPQAWVHEPHPESDDELKYWIDSHQIKPSKLPPTKTSSDGRPIMPDLNTFPGSLAEYNAALSKYEADFEAWALAQRPK